ncbi:MAG: alpha/beta hydrolase [Hyphomicrobiales bacterium]|nr:alpha/beta hydrolase [Hyphomicrobiales bacterium]
MITDWDRAYDNRGHVGNEVAEAFFASYAEKARLFRDQMAALGRARLDLAYGPAEREKLDIFLPQDAPKGLSLFIHGGFWRMFDKSSWSHLAEGALLRGWAVAMPSYTLAPEARISQITEQVAAAVGFAAMQIEGPVRIAGHSAGGHLASRMHCMDVSLSPQLAERIEHVVSISGLSDMRPLLNLSLNGTFRFDATEAVAESPALRYPRAGASVTCWVGGAELPEFIRQNDLLANIWTGLGVTADVVHAPGKTHFNVLDDLLDPQSALSGLVAP